MVKCIRVPSRINTILTESFTMRAKQFTEAALGTTPKRPARAGSRPVRGHKEEPRYGISKDQETEFHAKLDKLVHNTFGKRDDEMEEVFPTPTMPPNAEINNVPSLEIDLIF